MLSLSKTNIWTAVTVTKPKKNAQNLVDSNVQNTSSAVTNIPQSCKVLKGVKTRGGVYRKTSVITFATHWYI